MKQLIKTYLKGFARICAVAAPLLMLVEVLMDLQQPTLMANIIDVGVAKHNLPYVLLVGRKMIVFAVIGFIGGAGCSVFASIAAINMCAGLRQGLFNKIQSLSFAEIDHFKTSSLITRLTNDVAQVQAMMLMMLRVMIRSPIICLGGIVMSILLIPKFTTFFAIILPVIIFCIILVLKKSVPLFTQVQERLDSVNTVMRENLLGVRVVKTFGIEGRQFKHFSRINNDLTTKSIQAQEMTFLLMPLVTLFMNLSVVSVLWFGGNWAVSGSLAIGKIMAFINYLVQITHSLLMTVNLVVNISRAQASAARINEVLQIAPSVTEPVKTEKAADARIEFHNVSFSYNQSCDYVLKNISFSVKPGQTIGIIGATGSGKSTLISLIARLYDTTAGSIFIGGVDVRRLSQAELRQKVGIVMQNSTLFSGTVGNNLRFGNRLATDAELVNAASDAQAGFINELPQQFDSPVEQRGQNFSGGQQQRLSIARTLLGQPEILILDDSTSAVDLATEARLRAALTTRMHGRSMIIIAQRVSAIKHADNILVLDHGRISAMGSHAELIKSSPIYRSIVASQFGEEALANATG
jgi:ATP-binding cassette subfamily B multidrug efflux pump